MRYTTRPLSDRTWLRPDSEREYSRFDTTWPKTQALLAREVDALGGRDLVIEVDVPERGIRLDGQLRADAKAASPAVVVAFESKHGPMLYRCDRFVARWSGQIDWQHNVRAIALTLEALRAVDRYGATETGQQYAGFKALPAGRAMPASHMTRERAIAILASYVDVPPEHLNLEAESLYSTWRRARRAAHPDRHAGDRTLWDQVEQAARVLGVAA
ncbi:hypothetical protein [Nocardioides sp. SYSU DS0663]|uniref:hypothetical protein n=1 Tax=Nocardioides sp. SYSU DS0663 TaxID=3416445 RepID=UPI003F4BAE04